jgi:hypothetical protein
MSFRKLTKIIGAGLFAYEAVVAMFALAWALFLPRSMVSFWDASIDTAIWLMMFFFGIPGIMAAMFLFTTWCLFRLLRSHVQKA